jgi:glyoxylase-like metal-dependent hydrolase (beta-lactamase superfamily II)
VSADTIAPGITRVPTSRGDRDNAFLVAGDDGITLVDVGWAGAPEILVSALAELGRSARDIKRVVITHAHPDHVRGLAGIRERAGAQILIHAADAAWLQRGRVPAGGRHAAIGALLDAMPLLHWTPVTPDAEVADGELIAGTGGLRVIHTPGHTPGHIVLLHEPTRTLLAGDAVFHRRAEPSQGPDALSFDPAARDASLARLPSDVAAVGFAHGPPLTGTRVEHYQSWLEQAAKNP